MTDFDLDGPIVLFDGDCGMCDRLVRWVIRRDAAGRFRFAALQSSLGRTILEWFEHDPATDSLVLVERDRFSIYSTASLRIAKQLPFPWCASQVFLLVPRFLRDAVYRYIAARRHRLFGPKESCPIPTPEERARVLDGNEQAALWRAAMESARPRSTPAS